MKKPLKYLPGLFPTLNVSIILEMTKSLLGVIIGVLAMSLNIQQTPGNGAGKTN